MQIEAALSVTSRVRVLHRFTDIISARRDRLYSIHTVRDYSQMRAASGYQVVITSFSLQYDRTAPLCERWVWAWRCPCDLPGRWKKCRRRVPRLGLDVVNSANIGETESG